MPYLVRTIRGANAEGLLGRAFVHLALAWVSARPTRRPDESAAASWRVWAKMIRNAERRIKVEPLDGVIDGGLWRPIEVFDGLGHMEVMLAAFALLRRAGLRLDDFHCAPTQQSADDEAMDQGSRRLGREDDGGPERMADMEARQFAVEVYGGVNYRGNSKLAHDMRALYEAGRRRDERIHLFLAFRKDAILRRNTDRECTGWEKGDTLEATCSTRHGGPYKMLGRILKRTPFEEYVLLELGSLRLLLGPRSQSHPRIPGGRTRRRP